MEVGVGSGVGKAFTALSLLLLKIVSTGTGTKRLFPAKSFLSTPDSSATCPLCLLLLRAVVSTGSGANRRTFLTVSSTGTAWKRLAVGCGDVSGIVCAATMDE
jgi:hypothetical protein